MNRITPLLRQPERVTHCLGANNYTWVHFQDGKKEIVAKSISVVEAQLPSFVRVHKRVLVNPSYIQSVHQFPLKKGEGELLMKSGEVLPISRRRWSDLTQRLSSHFTEAIHQVTPLTPPPSLQTQPADSAMQSILLVTDDSIKAQRIEELIRQKWGTYSLQTTQSSSLLTSILPSSSTLAYPTLILLDAQTGRVERMNTLRALKTNHQSSHIPVVLFVCPSDQFVVEGYQHQANSVVAIPNVVNVFEQYVERILRFWLKVAALPK